MTTENAKRCIDPEVYKALKMVAVSKGLTITKALNEAVEMYVLFNKSPLNE